MPRNKDHLILQVKHIQPSLFKGTGRGKVIIPPIENRLQHAQNLSKDIQEIEKRHPVNLIYTVRFNGNVDTGLFFEALDQQTSGMELLSIKESEGKIISANVRVNSEKAFKKLKKKLSKYGASKQNSNILSYIGSISSITDEIQLDDLFMDDPDLLPCDNNKHWWKIWISNNEDGSVDRFIASACQNNITLNDKRIVFLDRTILLCQATKAELNTFIQTCRETIAEIYIAKTIKPSILGNDEDGQENLVSELLQKIIYPKNDNPRITILDEGLIVRHDLLDSAIVRNLKAVENFADNTSNYHTTSIGSLATLGDINKIIESPSISLNHKIESIQIIDRNGNDKELWGAITKIAVDKTVSNDSNNAYIMPITSENSSKEFGKPTDWSSAIDTIIFENKKVFAISVGNISDIVKSQEYPPYQQNSCIEEPAQSWNAISVGAYTEMANADLCAHNGVVPLVNSGDLSPYSRTSCAFSGQWPIKPEVVFEGGNRVVDKDSYVWNGTGFFDLVACSSTRNNPSFVDMSMTSAATGLAGKFIGELMAKYPTYWAETIRGLMVHSAEWTKTMLNNRLPKNPNQEQFTQFVRTVGYGVPNTEAAKYSASSALTIIAEKEFQVYDYKKDASGVVPILKKSGERKNEKTCQILIFKLPWPKDLLESDFLWDKKIKLKFTLSYFIEPNPSSRGYAKLKKFSYQSHNLRFDLQLPTEASVNDFMDRINANITEEENDNRVPTRSPRQRDNREWTFGKKSKMQTAGSIHKNELITNGADLAGMQHIAIYSVGGWWKDSRKKRPEETKTKFSLIISIDAGNADVDIYTPIQNLIPNLVHIPVSYSSPER